MILLMEQSRGIDPTLSSILLSEPLPDDATRSYRSNRRDSKSNLEISTRPWKYGNDILLHNNQVGNDTLVRATCVLMTCFKASTLVGTPG